MPDTLARRWIGWHVAAFALNSFLGACLYNLIRYPLDWALSAWPHVTQACLLGIPVGAAQALSTEGRRFPVPALTWIPLTAAGVGLGSWAGYGAMSLYIRSIMIPLGRAQPELERILGYGMVVTMLSASAAVLAGGHALLLLWKVSARPAALWWAWAGGAWFTCELAGFVCGWAGMIPGETLPRHQTPSTAAFAMALASAQGGLFALLTLPLFRRVAPPEA